MVAGRGFWKLVAPIVVLAVAAIGSISVANVAGANNIAPYCSVTTDGDSATVSWTITGDPSSTSVRSGTSIDSLRWRATVGADVSTWSGTHVSGDVYGIVTQIDGERQLLTCDVEDVTQVFENSCLATVTDGRVTVEWSITPDATSDISVRSGDSDETTRWRATVALGANDWGGDHLANELYLIRFRVDSDRFEVPCPVGDEPGGADAPCTVTIVDDQVTVVSNLDTSRFIVRSGPTTTNNRWRATITNGDQWTGNHTNGDTYILRISGQADTECTSANDDPTPPPATPAPTVPCTVTIVDDQVTVVSNLDTSRFIVRSGPTTTNNRWRATITNGDQWTGNHTNGDTYILRISGQADTECTSANDDPTPPPATPAPACTAQLSDGDVELIWDEIDGLESNYIVRLGPSLQNPFIFVTSVGLDEELTYSSRHRVGDEYVIRTIQNGIPVDLPCLGLEDDLAPGENAEIPGFEQINFVPDPELFLAGGQVRAVSRDFLGRELWLDDLDGGAPTLLADFYPGSEGSSLRDLTRVGDRVVFAANSPTFGLTLGTTDGTPQGTQLFDIPTDGVGPVPDFLTRAGDRVVFALTTPDGTGRELGFTDGTQAGTEWLDLRTGSASSSPFDFAIIGDLTYFTAINNDDVRTLWRTDGTVAGTSEVAEVQSFSNFAASDDDLFFENFEGLQVLNGDGSAQLLVEAEANVRRIGQLHTNATGAFFTVSEFGSLTNEIWFSDGTVQGTQARVEDVLRSSIIAVVDDALFYVVNDTFGPNQVWVDIGGNQTLLVNDGFSGTQALAATILDGEVYFPYGSRDSYDLYRTDGTVAGTEIVIENTPLTSARTIIDGQLIVASSTNAYIEAEG